MQFKIAKLSVVILAAENRQDYIRMLNLGVEYAEIRREKGSDAQARTISSRNSEGSHLAPSHWFEALHCGG